MSGGKDPLIDAYLAALRERTKLGVNGVPGAMFRRINERLDDEYPLPPVLPPLDLPDQFEPAEWQPSGIGEWCYVMLSRYAVWIAGGLIAGLILLLLK